MNILHPIAKLPNWILIVNKNDVPFIGKERALEVMCIQVSLRRKMIFPIAKLEKHLKFNPWEEIIDDEEKSVVLQEVESMFSSEDVSEKIIGPLMAYTIQLERN
ncbi:hypothetical protein J4G07_11590 [Candidatus Poribacteria bacterium]|nr:hypothetical protein [Candidatus Poribacteria bacterium]